LGARYIPVKANFSSVAKKGYSADSYYSTFGLRAISPSPTVMAKVDPKIAAF